MGSCLDILEEEEQDISTSNKENDVEDNHQEVSSPHEMEQEDVFPPAAEIHSKMQTARLKPLVCSNGLQRDNSTKEADPSGRIFRYFKKKPGDFQFGFCAGHFWWLSKGISPVGSNEAKRQ